jgi:ubiquinol-cytochrome c reductase iron-sulfur subunit
VPFLSSWLPSGRAKAAGAPVQVDISKIQPGDRLVVEWRGKPVWIIRRSPVELENLKNETVSLRDPDSNVAQQPAYAKNEFRSRTPEYLILVGVCTHLGCSPNYVPGLGTLDPSWPGGFYCPCHGSKFDLAGRVFTGVPAPINLEVPPYRFLSETVVVIGEDESGIAA